MGGSTRVRKVVSVMVELVSQGRRYRGRTVESVARRLFGRTARVEWSADPSNPQQVMVVREDRYGIHVLGEFRAYAA